MFLKLRSGFDCELSTVQCQLFICLSYRVGQALAWPLADNYFFRLTIPPAAGVVVVGQCWPTTWKVIGSNPIWCWALLLLTSPTSVHNHVECRAGPSRRYLITHDVKSKKNP